MSIKIFFFFIISWSKSDSTKTYINFVDTNALLLNSTLSFKNDSILLKNGQNTKLRKQNIELIFSLKLNELINVTYANINTISSENNFLMKNKKLWKELSQNCKYPLPYRYKIKKVRKMGKRKKVIVNYNEFSLSGCEKFFETCSNFRGNQNHFFKWSSLYGYKNTTSYLQISAPKKGLKPLTCMNLNMENNNVEWICNKYIFNRRALTNSMDIRTIGNKPIGNCSSKNNTECELTTSFDRYSKFLIEKNITRYIQDTTKAKHKLEEGTEYLLTPLFELTKQRCLLDFFANRTILGTVKVQVILHYSQQKFVTIIDIPLLYNSYSQFKENKILRNPFVVTFTNLGKISKNALWDNKEENKLFMLKNLKNRIYNPFYITTENWHLQKQHCKKKVKTPNAFDPEKIYTSDTARLIRSNQTFYSVAIKLSSLKTAVILSIKNQSFYKLLNQNRNSLVFSSLNIFSSFINNKTLLVTVIGMMKKEDFPAFLSLQVYNENQNNVGEIKEVFLFQKNFNVELILSNISKNTTGLILKLSDDKKTFFKSLNPLTPDEYREGNKKLWGRKTYSFKPFLYGDQKLKKYIILPFSMIIAAVLLATIFILVIARKRQQQNLYEEIESDVKSKLINSINERNAQSSPIRYFFRVFKKIRFNKLKDISVIMICLGLTLKYLIFTLSLWVEIYSILCESDIKTLRSFENYKKDTIKSLNSLKMEINEFSTSERSRQNFYLNDKRVEITKALEKFRSEVDTLSKGDEGKYKFEEKIQAIEAIDKEIQRFLSSNTGNEEFMKSNEEYRERHNLLKNIASSRNINIADFEEIGEIKYPPLISLDENKISTNNLETERDFVDDPPSIKNVDFVSENFEEILRINPFPKFELTALIINIDIILWIRKSFLIMRAFVYYYKGVKDVKREECNVDSDEEYETHTPRKTSDSSCLKRLLHLQLTSFYLVALGLIVVFISLAYFLVKHILKIKTLENIGLYDAILSDADMNANYLNQKIVANKNQINLVLRKDLVQFDEKINEVLADYHYFHVDLKNKDKQLHNKYCQKAVTLHCLKEKGINNVETKKCEKNLNLPQNIVENRRICYNKLFEDSEALQVVYPEKPVVSYKKTEHFLYMMKKRNLLKREIIEGSVEYVNAAYNLITKGIYMFIGFVIFLIMQKVFSKVAIKMMVKYRAIRARKFVICEMKLYRDFRVNN